MQVPISVQHKANQIKKVWSKEMDREATGPTWDPERRAWWITMDMGDDIACDDELHEMFGGGMCDKSTHAVAIGIRFVHTKRNHGTWTDGGTCRIMIDGAEVNGLEFSKVMSLMAQSPKFGAANQSASSQSALSSTLDAKKNTVIRV